MTNKDGFKTYYALSLAWQLGFLIAVPIGGFLILGYWLDKKFASSPLILIIGIVLGLVVAVYEIYHLLAPLIKNDKEKDDH